MDDGGSKAVWLIFKEDGGFGVVEGADDTAGFVLRKAFTDADRLPYHRWK